MLTSPHNAAFRADFECSCFTYEGIDAVKEALRAGAVTPQLCQLNKITNSGIAAGNPEIPIRINLIAPPVYVMTCSTPDKADGLAVLTEGCKVECLGEFFLSVLAYTYTYIVQAVEEKIKGSGGNFVMQMAPKAIQAFHVIDANDNLM